MSEMGQILNGCLFGDKNVKKNIFDKPGARRYVS